MLLSQLRFILPLPATAATRFPITDGGVVSAGTAIKAIRLVCAKIADAVIEGKAVEAPAEVETAELSFTEAEEPIGTLGSYTFNPEGN